MSQLILSIVVATYNSSKYIEECLKSIERAKCPGVEFILVDGASIDNTMKICELYSHLFSHMICEPDKGQSDAFNKGFKAANGRFLTWLNSDDVILEDSVSKVLSVLRKTKKDWLVANSVYLDDRGQVIRFCRSGGFERFAVKNGVLNVFGPSTFFSKKLYQEIGGFDESFHYCMDTEYWWRIVKSGRIYERINVYFWGLRLHSDAKTANVLLTGDYPSGMREESKKIADTYFPHVSSGRIRRAIFKARIWRTINFSYVRAIIDTWRGKGKRLKTF